MIKFICDKCGFNVESDNNFFQLIRDGDDPLDHCKTTLLDVCHSAGFTMVHVDEYEYLLCGECYGTFKNIIIPRANTERNAIIDNWLKEQRSVKVLGGIKNEQQTDQIQDNN